MGDRGALFFRLVAVLALMAIFAGLRRARSTGAASARNPVVTILAEVEGSAEEEIREAVSFLLRTGLDVGPVVRTVPDPELERVLGLMRVDPLERLDPALAREVGARLGLASVVLPRLDRLGDQLLLALRVEDVEGGLLVGQTWGTVEEDGELLSLVDRELGKLLAHLGEDRGALARREALPFYTTSSLEALQAFVAANRASRAGDHEGSLALNREALRLDPAFAMAWRGLAAVPGQTREERDMAITRAVELSEHLPRYERLNIRARHALQSFQWENAIREYETLLAEYPEDVDGWMNLGYAHGRLGAFDRYLEASRESVGIRVGPYNTANLIEAALILGKWKEAREALALLEEHVPGHPATPDLAFFVAVGEGDLREASELCREGWSSAPTPPEGVAHLLRLARLAASAGSVGAMRDWLSLAGEATETHRLGLDEAVWLADFERMTLGRSGMARAHLAASHSDLSPDDVPPSSPWSGIQALVLLGRLEEAGEVLDRWMAGQPEKIRLRDRPSALKARAELALAEGRTEEALAHAREAARESHGSPAAEGYLAWAYDQANRPDSALAAFRRYLEAPNLGRWTRDPIFLPLAYERLGQLHEAGGETAEAARYHALFIDLWREADPELQPRVEAARRARARLREEP